MIRYAVECVRSYLITVEYGIFVTVVQGNDNAALLSGIERFRVYLLYLCAVIILIQSRDMMLSAIMPRARNAVEISVLPAARACNTTNTAANCRA